jgi:hypothetical protein
LLCLLTFSPPRMIMSLTVGLAFDTFPHGM